MENTTEKGFWYDIEKNCKGILLSKVFFEFKLNFNCKLGGNMMR